MSISLPMAPAPALEALEADIGMFTDESVPLVVLPTALPTFVVDKREPFVAGDIDATHQPDAWCFFLPGTDGHFATCDVIRQGASYELTSLSRDGSRAKRLIQFMDVVRKVADPEKAYELRLFQVPAFHVYAFWLHEACAHEAGQFLVIDRAGVDAPSLMTAEQFAELLNVARENKLGPRGQVDYDTHD